MHKPYQYAVENGIKHVFIPGDISDVPNLEDYQLIALIAFLMGYEGHINTWYVLGNHDVHSIQKTSVDVLNVLTTNKALKSVQLFYKPEVRAIDGITVQFLPFPHKKLKETKRPPLVFCHIEYPGAIGDNGLPLRCKEVEIERVPGDFLISGHIHQYQYLAKKRLIYNGSLYQKNFGEKRPKGFIAFEARYQNKVLKVDHEFINARPEFKLETLVISEKDDWLKIRNDKSIRYKVLTEEGVVVPKDVMTKNPSIASINGVKKAKKNKEGEFQTEILSGLATLRDVPQFNVLTGLRTYMRQAGFSDSQIDRARGLVREAAQDLIRASR
jgi:hypothetical protein